MSSRKSEVDENKNRSESKNRTKKEQYDLMRDFVQNNNESTLGRRKFSEMWDSLTIELNKLGPPTHESGSWRKKWARYKYEHANKRTPKRLKLAEMNTDQSSPLNCTQRSESFDQSKETDSASGIFLNQTGKTISYSDQPSTSTQRSESFDVNLDNTHFQTKETDLERTSTTYLDSASGIFLYQTDQSSTLNSTQRSETFDVNSNQFQSELLSKLDVIIKEQENSRKLQEKSIHQQEKLNNLLEEIFLKNKS